MSVCNDRIWFESLYHISLAFLNRHKFVAQLIKLLCCSQSTCRSVKCLELYIWDFFFCIKPNCTTCKHTHTHSHLQIENAADFVSLENTYYSKHSKLKTKNMRKQYFKICSRFEAYVLYVVYALFFLLYFFYIFFSFFINKKNINSYYLN